VAAFIVFFGTIWPLVAEMFLDRKLSVGAPFFDMAFSPFMVVLGLVLPVGSMLAWKRARLGRILHQLRWAFVLAVAIGCLAFALQTGRSALGPVGLFLGAWLVAGALIDLWSRTGRGPDRLGRLRRLPRADWGKAVAHAGLGVTMAGVAAMNAWNVEDIRVVKVGETYEMAGHSFTLSEVFEEDGPNYTSTKATFDIAKDGRTVATLQPEKRIYPVAGMPTTEAAIDNGFLRDIYVVIGDPQDNGGWAVRAYYKPLANWIWGGAMLMALGGALSLSDRRYRVAAGVRSRTVPSTGVAAE
jgi:cytochrome c-type biogenesis protein CcmF